MKKYDKEILQSQLDNEKKVLEALKESYDDALAQINGKLAQLLGRQDADLPHVIYQIEYQKMLKTQVQAILENLQTNEFETVAEYLANSYNEGYMGALYSMQCQGVPLIFPIDQKQVAEAIQHETMLTSSLYTELGHDIKDLSKKIAGEISRGISAGQGYGEIARNLSNYAKIPLNNAMRIARTESHRIQCKSAMDAQYKARSKGADVVKEWNSYLDGKTRPHHRKLDGQIKELDEPFEVGGMKAMFPGDFGDPAEDCNCRCALLQRARWELDDEETQYLGDTSAMTEEQREEIAEKLGIPVDELDNYSESIVPLNAKSFDDFKEKYNGIWHYEGSEEQKVNLAIAEQTRQKLLSQRVRSSVQKMNNGGKVLENTGNSGIIKARGITQRNMSNGARTSPYHILTEEEIESIIKDAKDINIPIDVLKFNIGTTTGFVDSENVIHIRGNILPDLNSNNLRDRLSQKAVLAHEYYGHYKSHPSNFRVGDWRDEFHASYRAAIDTPNLSDVERRMLMLDAYDRAKEAGVTVNYNKKAWELIYGDE